MGDCGEIIEGEDFFGLERRDESFFVLWRKKKKEKKKRGKRKTKDKKKKEKEKKKKKKRKKKKKKKKKKEKEKMRDTKRRAGSFFAKQKKNTDLGTQPKFNLFFFFDRILSWKRG